jgi:DNA-binding GntR family transcriptional regulator
VRLSEKAYHLIKDKIITLELPPLAVIDVPALMEELELGHTPIRAALHRLAAEGLVKIVPRRGMFVADISITHLQKIFEVRICLEGLCARLAAQRITEDEIAQMEAVLQELEQVRDGDVSALMAIDERFHQLLYQAADNEFLAETLNRLYALGSRLWHLAADRLGGHPEVGEHWPTKLEALKARDGARAEALTQQDIAKFQQRIKALL